MSTEAEHLALADRNQAVLEHLLRDPATCAGWVAVVAFYKALHVLEAVFSHDPGVGHVHNHNKRLEILKKKNKYTPLFNAYRTLQSASVVARYLEDRTTGVIRSGDHEFSRFEDYMPESSIRPNLLDRYLKSFEQLAAAMLPPTSVGFVRYQSSSP